jgi:hypothetical protein
LTGGVTLYNATGTNGWPFVQYNFPLDPGLTAGLTLEFYDPTRAAFSNSLSVVPIIPPNLGTSGTNGSVAITNIFADYRGTNGTRIVVEFGSIPGKTYTILYAATPNATNWLVATPSVTANANITQWYDDGPPKTASQPLSVSTRFYRIIQN